MFGYFAAKRKNTRWACSSPAWAGDVFFDAISARNIFSTSRDADSQAFAISGQALTLHAPVVGRRLCRCRMPAEFVPRLVSPPMPHAAPSGYPLPRRRLETRAIDRRMGMDRLACRLRQAHRLIRQSPICHSATAAGDGGPPKIGQRSDSAEVQDAQGGPAQ